MAAVGASNSFEMAARATKCARRAAEYANAVAVRTTALAEHQERVAGSGASAAASRIRATRMDRNSEQCQRAAEQVHRSFLAKLVRWASLDDAATLLGPGLMGGVAAAAGWGAAVLTVSDRQGGDQSVAVSGPTARRLHDLEVILAEGPARDAVRVGALTADQDELVARWPRFGPAAWGLGVAAVAAVPVDLGTGEEGLCGSLTGFGPPMPAAEVNVCGLDEVAEALGQTVSRAPGVLGAGASDLPAVVGYNEQHAQPALHLAAGSLHARCGVAIDDALALIRAHAFGESRPVVEVAQEIIVGRLSLEP